MLGKINKKNILNAAKWVSIAYGIYAAYHEIRKLRKKYETGRAQVS